MEKEVIAGILDALQDGAFHDTEINYYQADYIKAMRELEVDDELIYKILLQVTNSGKLKSHVFSQEL